ncbi:PEP-CTERM sorting domain-containing protein [Roseateles sp. P5_D6]
MSSPRLFAFATLISLAATFVEPAQAQSYSFNQTGYADGATLSGHFAGSDLDGNGWLYAYELTEFELNWSGNRAVQAFNLGFSERAGLEFELSSGTLSHMAAFSQNEEGVRFFSFDSKGWPSYMIPGVVTDERLGLVSMSWEPLRVTAAVPEPQSLALLMAGMGFIGLWSQRRRAH